VVEPGHEVGRDGRVLVWVDGSGAECRVRVGGTGCFVREMVIEMPDG
jgi:predicted PhzF superfamily epimerase YddE/YHI9